MVAVLDAQPAVTEATSQLSSAGYEFEVLEGQEGKNQLDPSGDQGFLARLKRLASAFGDERRILDRLDQALDNGDIVVSVRADPDQAGKAIEILQDHGGEYIWKFGTWTFTRIGNEG